jgi:phosphoserine aminotransferase
LQAALVGRSHRSGIGKARIVEVVDRSREILGVPADWQVGIVAGSDTGAIEIAMWSLLGARGVDMLAWENFGEGWVEDVKQLKLPDIRVLHAPYGGLPDLRQVDWARDVVFPWNGTTSGVRVANGDWIDRDRKGLAICDATSAVFAMRLPWDKLDVVTWSWQKALGGEAAHGMLALSPRAVERLESYTPPWPLPKLFRLASKGKLIKGVFQGETINTPSMLCVEDALDSLEWAQSVGGLEGLIARSERNLSVVASWEKRTPWIAFLAEDPATISCTSPQLKIVEPWFNALSPDDRFQTLRTMTARLEKEQAAYDIASHRASPPGIRIWTGATVEADDVEALMPWLDWAWDEQRSAAAAA